MYDYDVFISYSSKDRKLVEPLVKWLKETLNLKVWFDKRSLSPASFYAKEICEALAKSKRMIYCLSPNAIASQWVENEFWMIQQRDPSNSSKTIVPVQIVSCKRNIPPHIQMYERVDLRRQSKSEYQRLSLILSKPGHKKAKKRVRCAPSRSPDESDVREQVLWRFAYAFFRLDQLPWGGWSRTLCSLMENIWSGCENIHRNAQLRTLGGTDMLSLSVYNYAQILDRFVQEKDRLDFINRSGLLERAVAMMEHLMHRVIGMRPGVIDAGNGDVPEIRHTAVTLAALLEVKRVVPSYMRGDRQISECAHFLAEQIEYDWMLDKSYLFGMCSALCKVQDLLKVVNVARSTEIDKLLSKLPAKLDRMFDSLREFDAYVPEPPTLLVATDPSFPVAYYRFWRFQRAGFLMYLPFLIDGRGQLSESGKTLLPLITAGVDELMRTIRTDETDMTGATSLANYHQSPIKDLKPEAGESPDWGLTASLLGALECPEIMSALCERDGKDEANSRVKLLRKTLLSSFDQYGKNDVRRVFRFTTGLMFSRILGTFGDEKVGQRQLAMLDDVVGKTLRQGTTELELDELIKWIVGQAKAKWITKKQKKVDKTEVWGDGLREFLVDKLEAGEHTPDPQPTAEDGFRLRMPYCTPRSWSYKINRYVGTTTISVYDGDAGERYIDRYGSKPIDVFVDLLAHDKLLGGGGFNGRKAVDVGCGPGQYAALLKRKGFDVRLLDASSKMLECAAQKLGLKETPQTQTLDALVAEARQAKNSNKYDLIFACAVMVHVPKHKAQDLYDSFYKLLKPGGVLFINFKISDHTLVSLDGRFYEFYRDGTIPEESLIKAGFIVDHMYKEINHKNLDQRVRDIRWVNFWCVKPCPKDLSTQCLRTSICMAHQRENCQRCDQ